MASGELELEEASSAWFKGPAKATQASGPELSASELAPAGSNVLDHGFSRTVQPEGSWLMAMFVILGETMGTGVLGLPYAASRLGWVLAGVMLPFFTLCAAYTGRLLCLVRTELAPGCTSYAEVAHVLVGPWFGKFTEICIVIQWGMILPYLMLACVESLLLIDSGHKLCFWEWGLVVVGILVPIVQFRTLSGVSTLALTATISIVIGIGLTLYGLGDQQTGSFGDGTQAGIKDGIDFLDFYSAFSAFILAYQGQAIFLELMSEMKEPSQFTTASTLSYAQMFIVYATCFVVAYGLGGGHVDPFVPNNLKDGGIKQAVGALVAYHVLIAYVIIGVPFHSVLHAAMFPESFGQATMTSRIQWFCISLTFLIFGWAIGNAIPSFASLTSLIGSLTGAPILFGWPAFFYAYGAYKKNVQISRTDKIACIVYLFVFLPVFTVIGTVASVRDIVNTIDKGSPFQCTVAA